MALPDDFLQKCYIHDIRTHGLRNIADCEIKLSDVGDAPVHLLITGDNGVGKTTFVRELYKTLADNEGGKPIRMAEYFRKEAKLSQAKDLLADGAAHGALKTLESVITNFCSDRHVVPDCAEHPEYYTAVADGDFLVFEFTARRKEEFVTPDGPKKIAPKEHGKLFIQMLVNLKTQSAFAHQREDFDEEKKIEEWFARFDEALAELLGHSGFTLEFLTKDFNFEMREEGKEPYKLTQLSDGYSAIISIISEIMMRMGTDALQSYDMPGIVIIDEIETHLHVELQKKILPFLTRMFPNLQFVITTHSPFILSSVSNAVIYDLGSHKRYEDFSKYSYSNIIENYYNISTYSSEVLRELAQIEYILSKEILTDDDRARIDRFDNEVATLEQPLELKNKWLTLKLKNIGKLINR